MIVDDCYCARDAFELIDVEYELFDVVVDARGVLDLGVLFVCDDFGSNYIFDWEVGDAVVTVVVFVRVDVVVE